MAEAESLQLETPRKSLGAKGLAFILDNILIFVILVAVAFSVLFGILMTYLRKGGVYTKREVMYIEFVGTLYTRVLKMVTLPLITTNMVASLTKLNINFARILGLRTFLYFLITSVLAAAWGIFLVTSIAPGRYAGDVQMTNNSFSGMRITMVDSVMDLIRAIFPQNYLEATINSYRTAVIPPMIDVVDENGTSVLNPDGSVKQQEDKEVPILEWEFAYVTFPLTNYISICIFSIVFGLAAIFVKKSTHMVGQTFDAISDVTILIVHIVVWASPAGIFFLVSAKIIEEKHWTKMVIQIGWYTFTVIFGVLTYGIIFLQVVYVVFVHKNPFAFSFNMIEAISTAFATSSSLVTVPITLKCVVEKNGIPPAIARFVCPIGASMNMNGAAIYEAVAPIFISQMLKRELTTLDIILTCIMSTLASIGTAGIPQSGLVAMVMVLSELNLEPDTILYIIPVEWAVDRFCTALNIFGDSIGAAVVFSLISKSFRNLQIPELCTQRI